MTLGGFFFFFSPPKIGRCWLLFFWSSSCDCNYVLNYSRKLLQAWAFPQQLEFDLEIFQCSFITFSIRVVISSIYLLYVLHIIIWDILIHEGGLRLFWFRVLNCHILIRFHTTISMTIPLLLKNIRIPFITFSPYSKSSNQLLN